MTKRRLTSNRVPVVIPIVRAVGEVEGLSDQLQVHAFADFEVLSQFDIEFKERLAADWIELRNGAVGCQIEAVLRAGIVSSIREKVR